MIEPTTVTVTIFGHQYTLRGDADPEYVEKVAGFVDRKMQEVADSSSAMSTTKVAILAAINVADELFRERQKRHEALAMLDEKTGEMARLLDREVGGSSGPQERTV
ncbi:MAG: cell division protein ZapA [Candidatus Krumholzibacteriia bacterium]